MLSHGRIIARLSNIDIINLPFIPPQIELDDLDDNLRLIPHDRLDINHQTHAIYTSQRTIAKNGRTIIRLAQHIESGAWEVCKSIDNAMLNPVEAEALTQTQQLIAHIDALFLMKYVPGVRLDSILSLTNTFSSSTYLDIASQLLRSLQTLHNKNFAHRDLHGGNILYDINTHELTIIDFGRAVCTQDVQMKIKDLQRMLWHLQACMRKTVWLKQHAAVIFRDTYSRLNVIDNHHGLNLFYHYLQRKLRSLRCHYSIPYEYKPEIVLVDVSEVYLYGSHAFARDVCLTDKSGKASIRDLLEARQYLQKLGMVVSGKVKRWV